jgi:hypothetical protein
VQQVDQIEHGQCDERMVHRAAYLAFHGISRYFVCPNR